jgi:hypothetical protein
MRTTAKFLMRLLPLLGLCLLTARAVDEKVESPAKRTEAIDQGKALLATKDKAPEVKDPFHSIAYDQTLAANTGRGSAAAAESPVARPVSGPRANRDLLQAIAANLQPSGYFVLGGEPTLVFGQKRVKAGGSITIRFEDADYTLQIVSIERPNFTLRLNNEEFTRPIK